MPFSGACRPHPNPLWSLYIMFGSHHVFAHLYPRPFDVFRLHVLRIASCARNALLALASLLPVSRRLAKRRDLR